MTRRVLLSRDIVSGDESPTELYQYDGFIGAIGVYSKGDMGSKHFYLGAGDLNVAINYGLVNIALFLSQATIQSVANDVCDEISWEKDVFGRYPISNACGQGRFSGLADAAYEDTNQCEEDEASMACSVDPDMTAIALTNPQWAGAPPPLECYPNYNGEGTGAWDSLLSCTKDGCNFYDGQVRGSIDPSTVPSSNSFGRKDVEGCCWWGRGAFPRGSAGTCAIGKLNYYLGKRAHDDGRLSARYDVDFCDDPSSICRGPSSDPNVNAEIRWLMGIQFWVEKVQGYTQDGWSYIDQLHNFVDKGLVDTGFFDNVSRIVTRQCHDESKCGKPFSLAERRDVFDKIIDIFAKAQTGKLDIEETLAPIQQEQLLTSPPAEKPSNNPTSHPSDRPIFEPPLTTVVETDAPITASPTTKNPTSSPSYTPSSYPSSVELSSLSLDELSYRLNFANNYCATSLDDAKDRCTTSSMMTCNKGDPPCAVGTACFGNVLCSLPMDNVTNPTLSPQLAPNDEQASISAICGGVCLVPLDTADCPVGDAAKAFLPDCLNVAVGGVCEGNGECGTNPELKNCGNRNIYTREFYEKCSSNSDSTTASGESFSSQPSSAPSHSSFFPSSAPTTKSEHPSFFVDSSLHNVSTTGIDNSNDTIIHIDKVPESVQLKETQNEPGEWTWWAYVPSKSSSTRKFFSISFFLTLALLVPIFSQQYFLI